MGSACCPEAEQSGLDAGKASGNSSGTHAQAATPATPRCRDCCVLLSAHSHQSTHSPISPEVPTLKSPAKVLAHQPVEGVVAAVADVDCYFAIGGLKHGVPGRGGGCKRELGWSQQAATRAPGQAPGVQSAGSQGQGQEHRPALPAGRRGAFTREDPAATARLQHAHSSHATASPNPQHARAGAT